KARLADALAWPHGSATVLCYENAVRLDMTYRFATVHRTNRTVSAFCRVSDGERFMMWLRAILVTLVSFEAVRGADWPQWRGPIRDGVSTETGLLTQWPDDGPPMLWEAKGAGRGYSSMACVGGKVYTVGDAPSTENDKDEYLICCESQAGKTLWQTKLGKPY